jgi:hypothetical protein
MRLHALILLALTMSARLEPLFAEESLPIQPGHAVGSIYGKPVTAADIGLTAPIDTALEFDARDSQQWQLMGRIAQAFGKPISDRFMQERRIAATEEEIADYKRASRERRQMHLRETEDQLEKVKGVLGSPGLSSEARTELAKEQAKLEFILPRLRDASAADVSGDLARIFIVARKTERELHKTYGGRVIFQQAGPEALDARRRLFEMAEARGDLKFDDAGVRHLFYYYFTKMKHVAVDEKLLAQDFEARSDDPANERVDVDERKQEIHAAATLKASQKPPAAEKQWLILQSASGSLELEPTQIVPVESGVWFGGRQRGSEASPIGYMDLDEGGVTLLLENGSANWDAVGEEAVAVQLDRKSLVKLNATDQHVAAWEHRPEGCKFFSQVVAFENHFCVSSPYNPLWIFDRWLRTWQKIGLKPVTDADSANLPSSYYQPSMNRFVLSSEGDIWGFQGTHDATRGNAVCHYRPDSAGWEQYGFPWAMARGDDHWPIGVTDRAVFFAGRNDLLLFDKMSRRWSTSELEWPQESLHSAKFTERGVLIPVGNTVKRLTPDSSAWESVASLDADDRITAIAVFGDALYLATRSGIHVLETIDASNYGEPKFFPWKLAEHAKTYKAVFGLATQDHALGLADKLCEAAAQGNLDRVRALLSEGADIEATVDPAGSTALLVACSAGHIQVAKLLLENGADIHARNRAGQNALVMAAEGRHRELADYLMSKGAKR